MSVQSLGYSVQLLFNCCSIMANSAEHKRKMLSVTHEHSNSNFRPSHKERFDWCRPVTYTFRATMPRAGRYGDQSDGWKNSCAKWLITENDGDERKRKKIWAGLIENMKSNRDLPSKVATYAYKSKAFEITFQQPRDKYYLRTFLVRRVPDGTISSISYEPGSEGAQRSAMSDTRQHSGSKPRGTLGERPNSSESLAKDTPSSSAEGDGQMDQTESQEQDPLTEADVLCNTFLPSALLVAKVMSSTDNTRAAEAYKHLSIVGRQEWFKEDCLGDGGYAQVRTQAANNGQGKFCKKQTCQWYL